MKNNRISFSSVTTFLECGEKFRLHYIERLRPKKTKSSLLLGSALDKAFNTLLEKKSLQEAYKEFNKYWHRASINGVDENIRTSPNVKYTKNDLDLDLVKHPSKDDAYNSWKTLRQKGLLLVKAYQDKVLPRIEEVIQVQKEVRLFNDQGDYIIAFIDLIAKIDGKIWICDNKTSSFKYPQDSAKLSQQLNIYHFIETVGGRKDIAGVCFIVMMKNIKKNKTKICSKCTYDGSGTNFRTCNNVIEKQRCDGTWNITINPEVDVDFVFNQIDPKIQDATLEIFDKANVGIAEAKFEKNTDNCIGKYGKCDYFELCHHKNRSNYVKV